MSFKDFKIIETIGKGSFASVYKVIRRSDNKVYALKRVKIAKMSKKEIADALNEIRFLASIRHKNIVGFLEAFLENNESELCIVMEFCGCGDLAQKVERYKKKKQYIDEKVIWRYLIQALKALNHLHEKGICHRDLKVANTFLAEDGSIKIGDMNVSKRLEKGQLKTQIGTPYYMSPEIWNNKPYDSRSDIWSLGCMIYELAALRPPFLGDSFPQLKRAITLGRYTALPAKYSDSLSRVLAQMLRLESKSRPCAQQLLVNPDVLSKLQLDETSTSFSQQQDHCENQILSLINTIKVPHNLNKLNQALPRPCYPDVRPNSPTSWTIAEQKKEHLLKAVRKAQPLPIVVPNLPLPSMYDPTVVAAVGKENYPVPSTTRSNNDGGDITNRSNISKLSALPLPPQQPIIPSGLSAVDEYYYRRMLAPVAAAAVPTKQQLLENNLSTDSSNNMPMNYKIQQMGYNKQPLLPIAYQPTLDPIPASGVQHHSSRENSNNNIVSYYDANGHFVSRGVAKVPVRPAGAAGARLQYHHRVW